ncbi:uncharacterized protein METZ01_LOCUS422469, partial [marine metagenome]
VDKRTNRLGRGVILVASDKLTVGNSARMRKWVLSETKKKEIDLTIDFSNTRFIDSADLEILLDLSKEIRDRGGNMTLLNVDRKLRSLMGLVELDSWIVFQDK